MPKIPLNEPNPAYAPSPWLMALLRSRAWQDTLNALPGYATDHCGEVAAMKRLLPW